MEFKVDAKGNVNITLPNSARTKAQQNIVNQMVKSNDITKVIAYLETFSSKRRRYMDINRVKADGYDALADKTPGAMSKLFSKLMRLDIDHKPHSTKETWVGVEIECCIPYETVGGQVECSRCDGDGTVVGDSCDCGDEACEDREQETCGRCEGDGYVRDSHQARMGLTNLFRDNKCTLTSIKTDGSISAPDGYFGIEITVLTKSDASQNLEKVCKLLNQVGAKVNKSCGLHVHLDARHVDAIGAKRMGKRLGLALPVLSQMLPKTRLNNRYCKMAVGGLRGGRYYAVNLEAFRKYETVEVRCHSSTTDYRKIMNWVEIVRAIAYSDIKKQVRTVNDLTDVVRIREDVVEYMTQRIEHFNPQPKSLSDLISEVKVDQAHAYADSDDITDLETREAIGF